MIRNSKSQSTLIHVAAGVLLAMGVDQVRAADLVGASQLIARVKAELEKPAESKAPKEDIALIKLGADADALRMGWTNMAPADAAAKWLELTVRCDAILRGKKEDSSPDPFASSGGEGCERGKAVWGQVFGAMPGPSTWAALKQQVETGAASTLPEQKRRWALTLLADVLTGDRAAFDQTLKKGESLFKKGESEIEWKVQYALQELWRTAAQFNLRSPADVVSAFRQIIENPGASDDSVQEIRVPDLVALAGEQEARKLLHKALAQPLLRLRMQDDGPTLRLYKEIVLSEIDTLTRPLWELISSPTDVSLFEALSRKFPRKASNENEAALAIVSSSSFYHESSDDYVRRKAVGYYVQGLIEVGRLPDAVGATLKEFETGLSAIDLNEDFMSDPRFTSIIADYCEAVLAKGPNNSIWRVYAAVAPGSGRGDAALKRIRGRIADPTVEEDAREELKEREFSLLLALDRVDDAAALCMEVIKNLKPTENRKQTYFGFRWHKELVTLGQLLKRQEWVDAGVDGWVKSCQSFSDLGWTDGMDEEESMLALKESGRLAEIEEVVRALLVRQYREKSSSERSYGYKDDQALALLASVYEASGRYKDVIALLTEAPWWSSDDLGKIRNEKVQVLGLRALVATGRAQEASRLARALLLEKDGDDEIYTVLADVEGERCLPYLDLLQRRNRFEERPLIWKAEVLRRAGKLGEAEAAARAALQVDPTDGEQSAGDRVRAYSVLAAILQARGKIEDAAFFNKVVESVRTAELGDKYTDLGLITRSVALYEKAEGLFGDAYCVQWRLAERLYELGRVEEAENHYAIAFERMPEQFGRVASFCFGCEGAFSSGASRGAAERILTRLAEKEPVRPQVYYLMGLLRMAQERKGDAADFFTKALVKDPEYFDAMNALFGLVDEVFMTTEERNVLMTKMLTLDPLQRHSCGGTQKISDFKTLWTLTEYAQSLNVKLDTDLFILTAAKERLASQKAKIEQMMTSGMPSDIRFFNSRSTWEETRQEEELTFFRVLVNHDLTRPLISLICE